MDKVQHRTIDIVKGIAILLVVYGHVIQTSMAAHAQDFFLHPVFKSIYTFHMPLFVFISGYLMAYSLNRKGALEVFKSRCRSLLVPFVVWGMLGALTAVALKLTNPSVWLVWFLFTLFAVSGVLILSVVLARRIGPLAFVLVYAALLLIPYNDIAFLYYIKWFYPFCAAGYFLNRQKITLPDKKTQGACAIAAVVMFIAFLPLWGKEDYIYINQMASGDLLRWLYRYMMGVLGIGLAFYAGAHLLKGKAGEALAVIGLYALDIYLLQRYLVEGIYAKLAGRLPLFDFNSPLFLCLFAPLTVMAAVVLCVLISKALIRKNAVLAGLLLGGRQ